MTHIPEDERIRAINCRFTPEEYKLIMTAANLEFMKPNAFAKHIVLSACKRIIEQHSKKK